MENKERQTTEQKFVPGFDLPNTLPGNPAVRLSSRVERTNLSLQDRSRFASDVIWAMDAAATLGRTSDSFLGIRLSGSQENPNEYEVRQVHPQGVILGSFRRESESEIVLIKAARL